MALFPGRTVHFIKIVASVLTCCVGVLGLYTSSLCASASTQATVDLSDPEKQELVRQAVAHYEQKEMSKAKEGLEQAQAVFPENYAVPYYLGLIYLEQGNRAGAIAQWQRYVKMNPHSENAQNIRKNITLLLREQARDFAKQAMAQEAAVPGGPADDNTIAVTSFSNLGSDNLGPLGKGMAAMLISDLSQVPDLQVVDRIKLNALLEEMKLGASGLVDSKTAPRVGKLLRAKHVTSGSLADLEKERLIIASAVVDADQKSSIGAQEAKGELKEFYDMEKQIACQIIEDLGRDCATVPAGFNKIHTRSMPALVSYSWGLHYFDEENYDEAREMFQKALEEDPQFDLAEEALLATPTAAMVSMETSQIVASASSSGPPSSVAGTAVVGASSTGSTVATAGVVGTVGVTPTTAIVAGVAALGGGVALAGGGGGGGGGSNGPPNQPTDLANLTGDWRGPWTDATGASGEATLSLTQSGSSINGTVSVTGDDCLSAGNVTGNVSGNRANLSIRSGGETVTLNGTYDNSAKTLNGTWDYTASASPSCAGGTGSFSTTLTTGGADINW